MVRIEVIAFSGDDIVEENKVSLSRCLELMDKYQTTWINIIDMDAETANELEAKFGIHALALEDCLDPFQRPKVEDYDDTLFIVTRTLRWHKEGIEFDQLSTFLMKKCIITIHKIPLAQLEAIRVRLRKRFPRLMKGGAEYLCFTILDVLVDSYIPEIDEIGFVLDKLETEILENPSKKTMSDIHQFREEALELRNVLIPERDTLMVLARGEYPQFKKDTRNYLRDVYDHMLKILDSVDTYRESSAGLLNMYFSSMQLQLNEVMKLLTIIATIMLPLTLIASIYGMNLPIPEAAHSLSYPFVIFVMILMSIIMLFYFRKKQWI